MRSPSAKSRRLRASCRAPTRRSISSAGSAVCRSSCRRSASTPSTWSKRSNAALTIGRVFAAELVAVDRRVQRADELEDRAERARRVQILLHRLDELRFGRSDFRRDVCMRPGGGHPIEAIDEICETSQRLLCLVHRVPAELQLLAVVRGEQQIPERRRPVAFRDDVGKIEDVAERLRHLLFVDQQVLDVHPEAGELFVRRPFALRDFVLMMREDEIDAAAVDVDRRLAQQPQGHRRALQMPSRPAAAESEVPARLIDLPAGPPRWASSPSTTRSRARCPCRSCPSRRGRRPSDRRGRAGRAGRTAEAWRS